MTFLDLQSLPTQNEKFIYDLYYTSLYGYKEVYKMSTNIKSIHEVTFYGKTEVKAFTSEEARAKVESLKTIQTNGNITTNTWYEAFAESLMLNLPAIFTGFVSIIYITLIARGFNTISTIGNSDAKLIALLVFVTLIMTTIRWPVAVGRWFKRGRY